MSALFLELASPPPRTFRLRMISSMVVLSPYGKVAKTLPVVRLATHKFILSVDAVVGVKLLATTLAGKHMATVLTKYVLARHLQRLESFGTDITGVNLNPLSLSCALSPHTDHIQQQHDFPHKPDLNTCRSRCQEMSTPLYVLLKADPCLKGDVADDKADPSVCLQPDICLAVFFRNSWLHGPPRYA